MLLDIQTHFKKIQCPVSAVAIVKDILATEHPFDREKEQVIAIGLMDDKSIKYVDLVSLGTSQCTLVHPRESFRHAVTNGVSSLIFLHNHPHGDPTPSGGDFEITKRFVAAGKILGIEVTDHIVVAKGAENFFSIREVASHIFE